MKECIHVQNPYGVFSIDWFSKVGVPYVNRYKPAASCRLSIMIGVWAPRLMGQRVGLSCISPHGLLKTYFPHRLGQLGAAVWPVLCMHTYALHAPSRDPGRLRVFYAYADVSACTCLCLRICILTYVTNDCLYGVAKREC